MTQPRGPRSPSLSHYLPLPLSTAQNSESIQQHVPPAHCPWLSSEKRGRGPGSLTGGIKPPSQQFARTFGAMRYFGRAPSPFGRQFVQALGPRVFSARRWSEDFSDLGRTDAEGGTCDVFFRCGLWMFCLCYLQGVSLDRLCWFAFSVWFSYFCVNVGCVSRHEEIRLGGFDVVRPLAPA